MKVICYTNLDLFNESWPNELPCRPMKGDYIQSKTKHPQYKRDKNGFSLGGRPISFINITLEICKITFKQGSDGEYQCHVELHDKLHLNRSLDDFYTWYAPIVGKTKHAFI